VQSLTGPLLTSVERQRQIAQQDLDEPPMPSWWDDDEDAAESSITAGQQLKG